MLSLGLCVCLLLLVRIADSVPFIQPSTPPPPSPSHYHLIAEHLDRSTQEPNEQFYEYDLPVLGRINDFLRRRESKRAEESSNAEKPRPLRFG